MASASPMRCRGESTAASRCFALPKDFVGMTAHNPDLQLPDRLAPVLDRVIITVVHTLGISSTNVTNNIYSLVPVTTKPPTC
jgi:hypothetical protein